jgi:hypothetical protein
MNDAKWRKVLTAIAAFGLSLIRSEWKFVDSDNIFVTPIPRLSDILPKRLADGRLQPVEYKWTEWISFPRTYRPYTGVGFTVEHDLDGLVRVLTGCRQLYVEREHDRLTVFGYGK